MPITVIRENDKDKDSHKGIGKHDDSPPPPIEPNSIVSKSSTQCPSDLSTSIPQGVLDDFSKKQPFYLKSVFTYTIILLYVVFQTSLPNLSRAAPSNTAPKYTNGFKIYQYNLQPGDSVADNPLPNAELGSFTAKKSEYSYREAEKNVGVSVNSGRLYRAVGLLNVKDPGNYSIITTSDGGPKYGCIYVNEKLAVSGRTSPFTLVAPVRFDTPGLYPVDIRIYDCIDKNLVVPSSYRYTPEAKFKFSIKTPDSEIAIPAHKVLFLQLK